jgi:hypothetical protein
MSKRTLNPRLLNIICKTPSRPRSVLTISQFAAIRMASSQQPSKRRFTPLGQPATDGAPALQGIVFDMDGTLCKSSTQSKKGSRASEDEIRTQNKIKQVSRIPSPLLSSPLLPNHNIRYRTTKPTTHSLTTPFQTQQASPKTTCSAKCAPPYP